MRIRRVTFGLAVLSFVGLAVFLSVQRGAASSSNTIAYRDDLSFRPTVAAGTPEDVLASVMRTYGGNLILSAHVSAPPPFTGARKGIWIDFEVAALGPTHEAIRAAWEADLVQGAVADNLAALGLGHVVGQRISIRLPDGTVAGNDPGGMGDITPGQQFQSPSDVVLKQTITDGLSAAGLSPVSVDVLHAAQPAPAVVAVSANPSQAAAAANQTVRDLFGQNPPKYEGAYFEVRDLKQNPVFILATSFRTGAGRLWFSSSVANDISLGHAGPARMGMRKTKETN